MVPMKVTHEIVDISGFWKSSDILIHCVKIFHNTKNRKVKHTICHKFKSKEKALLECQDTAASSIFFSSYSSQEVIFL